MKSIYSILNNKAKIWYWHKELRQRGQIKEARMNERKTIRFHVDNLRNGYLLSIGDFGSHLNWAKKESSGWTEVSNIETMIELCNRVNIPIVDSRGFTLDQKMKIIACPIDINKDNVKEYIEFFNKVKSEVNE